MKKYNIFILGIAVGVVAVVSTSGFANSALEKIEAYLNPNMSVELDGNKLALEKPVAIIDGNSYLPLKSIGQALGKEVKWNEQTSTIELRSISPSELIDKQKNTIDKKIYYKHSDVNNKYPISFKEHFSDHSALIVFNGKEYHIKVAEGDIYLDTFNIASASEAVTYHSSDLLLQYLTEDQLKEFKKYKMDSSTNRISPIQ
ncbi:stalk domain-containing protein [Paenibacillus planticolens]|uniref:Copper amine oxidase-like N-terminal domain-containing protein n=1 Tax=Paenibacillus planticolens TaxID=2654976 RepID=A0ABX2A0N6_9BACL|nr:stalk domain-containing protein [Paenibacillus planticolens]NOV04545.1 hypothetical protein [Paenibacillus planticolens]